MNTAVQNILTNPLPLPVVKNSITARMANGTSTHAKPELRRGRFPFMCASGGRHGPESVAGGGVDVTTSGFCCGAER
ncbi:MAG TPA: hypothetical protein PKC88_05360 [Plasticicumulans sp.]|nr:hypothetical protein [Plasticicumulans sp.]